MNAGLATSDTGVTEPTAPDHPGPEEPWARHGWLMWGVWLIFLVFPVLAMWRTPGHGLGWRVGGTALIVVFALVYLVGSILLARSVFVPVPAWRSPMLTLALLVALTLLSTTFLGVNSVTFTPFLVSFGAFALPRPWHLLFTGLVLVGTVLWLALADGFGQFGYFLFILVAVAAGVNASRVLADQSDQYAEVKEGLTISAERERVARDVHDVLGHSLTVVSVKAELAERLVDVDPERAKAELADIQRLSRQSLAEIRATVGGLRAARLSDELNAARSALVGAGIDAVVPDDAQLVDPTHRAVVGWALREAVTNVVRHSRAAHCEVSLGPHGLVVVDDGVGLGERRVGNGLRGLQERVAGTGGRLQLGPGPGERGTRLEVSW